MAYAGHDRGNILGLRSYVPVQKPTDRHDQEQFSGLLGALHWPLSHVNVASVPGAATKELLKHATLHVSPLA
jgi:hypothetical protein